MSHNKKVIFSSMIGNTLEFYDFSLFVFLSPILAPLFFPDTDSLTSLIMTLATYGVGYFMRPLGAIFFGHLGDKHGRKKSLSLSIILMSIPTVLIALLPTYAQIGIFSSIFLIILRLLQGFCTGGEFNGAGLYIVENTNQHKTSFYGSLISSSAAIGAILGSLISSIVTASFMPHWAWRIAFLSGGLIGVIGIYMRRNLGPEVFLTTRSTDFKKSQKIPLIESFKKARGPMICTFGIAAFSGAMYHLSFYYTSIFLITQSDWHLSNSLIIMSLGTIIYIFTVPIFGYLADKYGNKAVMITGSLATFIFIYPLFSYLLSAHCVYEVIGVQLCLALLSAWSQAPITAYMAKLFPSHLRYSGVAFSYSIGIALFGGSTPMICALLIKWTENPLMPAFYILILSLIGVFSVLFSKERPLNS